MSSGRNLVVCCDGTGNFLKPSADKTNVVKLVECLAADHIDRQLHYYDPGVGTPDGYLTERDGLSKAALMERLAGLVWGKGVWSNVAEAYRFLMTSYTAGDRIFLFGFSRGAFTARAVSGLINLCGLLRPGTENLLPTALHIYRMDASRPDRARRRSEVAAQFRKCFGASYGEVPIHFVGVWDTVESVGVAQLALGTHITSDRSVKPCYRHIRHAVALDELRWPYAPRLYDETISKLDPARQTLKQVWFAGAHCDVGGGYANAGLAHAALHWMVREANHAGLLVDFDKLNEYLVDVRSKLHDETVRIPAWMLVGAFKRKYLPRMTVHESVVQRMNEPQSDYRPPLPEGFTVERTQTHVLLHEASAPMASASAAKAAALERAVPTHAAVVPLASTDVAVGPLPRQRVGLWHWVTLLVSGAVTGWRLLGASAAERELAALQVTMGWYRHLGEVLANWETDQGASVNALLAWDLLTIVAYTAFIAVTMLLLSRLAGRNGYPSRGLGKLFCYSGGLLPVADVLENALTWVALSAGRGQSCFWLPCEWTEAIASVLTSVSSVAKFAFAAAFIAACVVALLAAALRLVRRS